MERNRINFAKYCILRYAEDCFDQICSLLSPKLAERNNLPAHGLERSELVIVLHEMFASHELVAKHEKKGLFTPTLDEIESALDECLDSLICSEATYYGITSGAYDLLNDLRVLYKD